MTARVIVAALAALLAAVAVGQWERGRRADEETAGMRAVVAAIGDLDSQQLSGFRIFVNFDCLTYERGRNDVALEVCVDHDGRVVEAIDRRDGTSAVWSLRDDRTRSDVRVDRAEVDALLERMTA